MTPRKKAAKKKAKKARRTPFAALPGAVRLAGGKGPLPKKLSAAAVEKARLAARSGGSLRAIASAVGVLPQVIQTWLQRGEEFPESREGAFFTAVRDAQCEAEDEAIRIVREAFTEGLEEVEIVESEKNGRTVRRTRRPDWRASMGYLERRHPEEWSPRREVAVSGDVHVKHIIMDGEDPFADLRTPEEHEQQTDPPPDP